MEKHFKLPEPFLTNWKEALRSGKYSQGDGKLLTTEEYENYDGEDEENEEAFELKENSVCFYCCLGVAGDIAGFDRNSMFTQELFDRDFMNDDELGKLPEELVMGSMTHVNEMVNILTSLNDGINKKTVIEKQAQFKGLVFQVPFPERESSKVVNYTFEQIADWLDHNVQGYQVSEES